LAVVWAVIELEIFYRLLEVDEDEPLHELVTAARNDGQSVLHLLLSVLERDGARLGSGATDELARARDRAAEYDLIRSAVGQVTTAQVVKGPSLGRHYPQGLRRPVGDLDLVVADEESLWLAIRAITETVEVEHIDVTLLGAERQHLLIALSWPAKDRFLDPDCSVDISTAAFTGDLKTVGCRPRLPDDPLLADLLSLAEERFQRPFTAKDIIDVLVLAALDLPPAGAIVQAADELLLAPELSELLVTASKQVALGPLAEVIPLAQDPAVREKARRSEAERAGVPADDPPLYGMLLQRTAWRQELRRAVVHDFVSGTLLRAPVGDYLLVSQEIVTRPQFDAAIGELSSLGEFQPAASRGVR
jgi:hypothetical protein